ncbi:MAG: hypothetical protein ACOVMN_08910 [Flexibacteraceae bacterium]
METLKERFDIALAKKRITAKQMLGELGLTEQAYYKALRINRMKTSTYFMIANYLGISEEKSKEPEKEVEKESEKLTSKVSQNEGIMMYDLLMKTIKEQAEEIALLKRELGKFDSTFLPALSA